LQLRSYQQAAVDAAYEFLRARDGNPLLVLPVGAGKSIVIAQIVKDAVELWGGRILVVTHSAELVEQNARKIKQLCPSLDVGIFCAGLNRRDVRSNAICASIQSVYRHATQVDAVDLIIVDEAHAIPPDGEGMYRTFLQEAKIVNPGVRLLGTTATPFRTSSGLIFGPDQLFDDVCFEAGIKELITQGYLAPLVTKSGATQFDTSGLRVSTVDGTPDVLAYRDFRFIMGLERKIIGGLDSRIEVGYIFNRDIRIDSEGPADISMKDSVLLRAGIVY
jgi:DNA repair protein RadD